MVLGVVTTCICAGFCSRLVISSRGAGAAEELDSLTTAKAINNSIWIATKPAMKRALESMYFPSNSFYLCYIV